MKFLSSALLTLAALSAFAEVPARPQQVQEETVYIDEVKKDFLEKIQRCEESKDWRELFGHYAHGLRRYSQKVIPIDKGPNPERYTSVSEFLTQRLSRLPKEAYEYYRLENDGRARALFDRARELQDRRKLEQVVEDYFFATVTDDALDVLGNQAFDEGRVEEAVFYWNRLLRCYPDSKIPRSVTAARIGNACRLAENEAALNDLRQYVSDDKLEGAVTIGGQGVKLGEYLKGLAIPVRVSMPRPLKVPYSMGPEDRDRRKVMGVRNDIRRWVYDFAADKGEPVGKAEPEQPNRLMPGRFRRGMEGLPAPQFGDFPFFPAYSKIRGRDYVVFTDGTRVVAIDPAKVKGTSATTGVYWKFPTEGQILRPNPNGNGQMVYANRPYAGVAIDGDYAYATMVSRLEVRPRDNNPNNFDFFEGTTSVKCFHIPTGKLVWDTDASPLYDEMKVVCKDFFDRNFSFSSQALLRGDRLYLGICTSPVGEQESRVLCLDKKTGKPLWCTFVASISGARGNPWNWGNGRGVVYQTLLAEQGGALYALTNLGCVAALNGVTGNILWLTKYRRSGVRNPNAGVEVGFLRPANWPIVWKGQILALPQDRAELAAFDKISGKEIQLPQPKTREGELDWKNMTHLVGIVDDWMVIGGAVSHVIRLRDFQAYSLASSNTSRAGRGVIEGDLVYLPAASNQGGNQVGVLAIYDVRTWKSLDQPSWKEPNEYGNLLVAGNYLVVATQKVTVYTDVETLRNEFAARLYQSPPHAGSLFEYGETMRENDRLEEAAEAYLGYIRAAEGDPALRPRVLEVKKELHGIFIKRGDEASERGDQAKALEFYQFAKGFAFDARTEADSTKRMAQTYEKLQRWKDAVGMYQELVQKGRTLYQRESDEVLKMAEQARRSIDGILAKTPEAYEEIEKQAAEALRKAKEGSTEALKDVMDRFPNSKTARDAWAKMRDTLLKEGKFEKLRSLYSELKDRFKIDLNMDSMQELLEILRKLKDHERMRYELPRIAERWGPEAITTEAGEETVKEYAERLLREIPPAPAAFLAGPLRHRVELDPLKPSSDPLGLASGCLPLRPLGVLPPGFGRDLELFSRGSGIELWNLKEKRLIWSRPHPGAYLGVIFSDPAADLSGVSVTTVKPGSPAEKAGLKRDDLILSLDGRPVTAASLTDLLAARAPGAPVEVAFRRPADPQKKSWTEGRAKVDLGVHPADLRPAIVGSSFTRSYELAVAWEDAVACLDLASGRVEWVFRDLRDRFHVRAFHATEGRLYIYEANRPDRDHDVLRSHTEQGRNERLVFRPEDAHHRLLCLSDLTGELAWARAFDFDPANPNQDTQVFFFDKYLSDQVAFLQGISRPGSRDWVLWSVPSSDGREPYRKNLMGQVLAHVADLERGILYYVADINNDRKERSLYSVSTDPSKKEFKQIDVALNAKLMPPTHFACALAANGERICLLVSPPAAAGEALLWSLNLEGRDERKIALPEGRTLTVGRAAGALLDANGLLYVYNIPKEKAAPTRAFLTGIRVAAKDPAEMIAWDAVAPIVANTPGGTWQVISEPGTCAIFTAARAAIPGQPGETPIAVVYDLGEGGYLRTVHSDLLVANDGWGTPAAPACWWRGRLYVNSKAGLQVYGD